MSVIDYGIVLAYLSGMLMIGFYFHRKATSDIESYFLGERGISWWALGASGMSGNLDVSGTMINAALLYALGMSGFFIEIRGGVTLILAFLMIFMGKWNRRAMVMTLAEWMQLRFGKSTDGNIARLIAAISIIIVTIAMTTYFAIGSGKFIDEFLGIPEFWGLPSEFWAAVIMIVLSLIYTVAGGLYGVVWTDVAQAVIIFGTIFIVGFMAFTQYALPESFMISMPMKDGSYQAFETTREAWTNMVPQWHLNIDPNSAYSIYSLFGIAVIFYLLKVTIEGSGGTSGYMIQRYFACKNDREAGYLTLFWTFLLSFRWPFIAAIAIMGITYGTQQGQVFDPERVLPVVISQLVPVGIKGFLISGLMAAGMSTFSATINAGAAYWVKDIYQAYINPEASEKKMIRHSQIASVIIVVLGLALSIFIKNINEIWGWLTMSIGAGLIMPMLIRWYWWRMNGWGFTVGTVFGMGSAIIQRLVIPDAPEYVAFSIATGMSLLGVVAGTYLTKPTDGEVLFNFYKTTRPFGWWGKIRQRIPAETMQEIHKENRRDIFSLLLAIPWQLSLFMLWMMLLFRSWDQFVILLGILIVLSIGLYFSWFRHLDKNVRI